MLPKLQFAICLIVYWRSKRCFFLIIICAKLCLTIEINLVGPLLGDGWYTNDKFTEAQPEAIAGKWLVGARLAKRWPTVTLQLANVGPTIVCYMGCLFVCLYIWDENVDKCNSEVHRIL